MKPVVYIETRCTGTICGSHAPQGHFTVAHGNAVGIRMATKHALKEHLNIFEVPLQGTWGLGRLTQGGASLALGYGEVAPLGRLGAASPSSGPCAKRMPPQRGGRGFAEPLGGMRDVK